MQGRPGINPLAFKASYQVDAKAMDELRRVSRLLGFEKQAQRDAGHFYSDKELKVGAAQVKLAGVTFTQGEEFSIIRELETKDLEENLRWIRDAKRQADYTLASIHSHEAGAKNLLTAEKKGDLADPAEINRNFSLAAIDNGADAVAEIGRAHV